MSRREILLIWASGHNGVIGRNGQIPWHLPDDFRHFQAQTKGHAIIMGRKTFESLPTGALPHRENWVLTRQAWHAPGVHVAASLPEALSACKQSRVFVIGGGAVLQEALPLADGLIHTLVDATPDGDAWFTPNFAGFSLTQRTRHVADERHAHAFVIAFWRRTNALGD